MLTTCRPETESVSSAPKAKVKKLPTKKKTKRVKPPQEIDPLFVLERKLTGHEDWVRSVAVSPDGSWLASSSIDKTVKIWDLETGECRATLEGHKDKVKSVAITPDGKRVLSGSNDNTIRVWDSANGQQLASWEASSHFVLSIAIMSDSRWMCIS